MTWCGPFSANSLKEIVMSKIKRIACLSHIDFEGPGYIAEWAAQKKIPIGYTRVYADNPFPEPKEDELVLIMGGPMSVYDYHIHPRMEEEVEWVRGIIRKGHRVLGICLGAQIMAAALEAEVLPGPEKEIGWFQLEFLPAIGDFRIWPEHPGTKTVFHWHGDTFATPEGAIRIAGSEAFKNQGFIYGNRVVALQFHLEMTEKAVKDLVDNCRNELTDGPHVQSEKEILSNRKHFEGNHQLMAGLMEWMVR